MAINKSTLKTLEILGFISKYPDGVSFSEIYKGVNLPKATVFDIIQALYEEDAIFYKDKDKKTYVIGAKLFAIGQAYIKNSNFINYATPLLQEFCNKYGITAFAAKSYQQKLVYVYKYESRKSKIQTKDISVQEPLINSVTGLTYLAFLNKEKTIKALTYIKNNYFDGNETDEYKDLLNRIEYIKNVGYGVDDGKTSSYIYSVTYPVFNFENRIVGVISFEKLYDRNESQSIHDEHINALRQVAKEISTKQGFRGLNYVY